MTIVNKEQLFVASMLGGHLQGQMTLQIPHMTSHIIIYLSANLNPNQALKNEVVVVELTILGADSQSFYFGRCC